jgi:hypothetical protein
LALTKNGLEILHPPRVGTITDLAMIRGILSVNWTGTSSDVACTVLMRVIHLAKLVGTDTDLV